MKTFSVIPLRRFPGRVHFFDYFAPDDQEPRVGQLVWIPFLKKEILGVVFKIQPSSADNPKMKKISKIAHGADFFSEKKLSWLVQVAKIYGISAGTLLKVILPSFSKKKLEKLNLNKNENEEENAKTAPPSFFLYENEKQKLDLMEKLCGDSGALIITAEKARAVDLYEKMKKKFSDRMILWHGEISDKNKLDAWLAIKKNPEKIIVGTRSAVFLPISGDKTLIMDEEHGENHKSWDQAPRFHVRDIVLSLNEKFNNPLFFLDYSPSCHVYYGAHKKNYLLPEKKLFADPRRELNPVNMKNEKRGGNFSLFSDAVTEIITHQTKDVFLYLNRLGFATSVGCRECGRTETCEKCGSVLVLREEKRELRCHYCSVVRPMPLTCPACHSPVLSLRGAGTELAENDARKIIGENAKIKILRLDGDSEKTKTEFGEKNLIIGTDKAWPEIRWERTEAVIFLDADGQIRLPEYQSSERIWHMLRECDYRLPAESLIVAQTFQPDHLVFRSWKEPDRFYRTDLNSRMLLSYPPYSVLARYSFGHKNKKQAEEECARVCDQFSKILTIEQKNAMVNGPLMMNPVFYQGLYWYMILVKMPVKDWFGRIADLNEKLPREWKVDINPANVLSH